MRRARVWLPLVLVSVMASSAVLALQDPPPPSEVGVDEKLGDYVPLDVTVTDAEGRSFLISEFVDRPTILTLVYYRCPDICTPLLMGLSDVIERMEDRPGEGYRVLTVSFNPDETPMDAMHSRDHMKMMLDGPWPEQDWVYTVADSAVIAALTEAVGFGYKRVGDDFTHPAVITVLSPEGRIARYLYGLTFLPFDVKMALIEAAEGRTGPTVNRVLLYCFSYDPDGQTYVFNILKVTGTLIMVMAVALFVFLMILGRRRKAAAEGED